MKPIIEIMMLFLYIILIGMFTLKVNFSDGTSFELEGWIC
jgi:uncharacterized membrane protein YvlD (DUF360 family)